MLLALPLTAAASRELVVPVVGHSVSGDGRVFDSRVSLINTSGDEAAVVLRFLRAGEVNAHPFTSTLRVPPHATRTLSADASLLGAPNAIGALLVDADREMTATVDLTGGELSGLPRELAVGTGQTALLDHLSTGDPQEVRTKLYVVETRGDPLYFAIDLVATDGRKLASTRTYLSGRQQLTTDLAQLVPAVPRDARVAIRGINGSGRIVAAAWQSTRRGETAAFDMAPPEHARMRMRWSERLAYAAVAFAIVVFALRR